MSDDGSARFIQVHNFEKFQHYKDRRPPWIKLYRDLLEDDRFFELSDPDRYHLIGLFILASQHDNKIPYKPKWLKHQLRASHPISLETLAATGWIKVVGQDASNMLAERKQLDDGETETEKRREDNPPIVPPSGDGVVDEIRYPESFERFWRAYPRRTNKGAALKAWKRLHPSERLQDLMLEALTRAKLSVDWKRENGRFIPYPATWLNANGWDSEYASPAKPERKAVY